MRARFLNKGTLTRDLLLITALCWLQPAAALETKSFSGIRFVLIEPGCFMMGNGNEATEKTAAESPSHRVCLTKPYYIGETEVTQKQWEDVMGSNPSKIKGFTLPVGRVSWNDIQDFLQKLNAKEGGYRFRLPTEAEWEYAARAGNKDDYSYGNDPKDLDKYAWFGNLGYNGSSHEVGLKQPNEWGLYDVHGNLWEWVQDWYGHDYYKSSPEQDPAGPDTGKYRVYRGGSWVGKAENLRSSVRFSAMPMTRTNDVGFRLVRQPD